MKTKKYNEFVPFLYGHLVYFKWRTLSDNSIGCNSCIYKGGEFSFKEFSLHFIDPIEVKKGKMKRINNINDKES